MFGIKDRSSFQIRVTSLAEALAINNLLGNAWRGCHSESIHHPNDHTIIARLISGNWFCYFENLSNILIFTSHPKQGKWVGLSNDFVTLSFNEFIQWYQAGFACTMDVKEMTVSEISKELGYDVKVVKE